MPSSTLTKTNSRGLIIAHIRQPIKKIQRVTSTPIPIPKRHQKGCWAPQMM